MTEETFPRVLLARGDHSRGRYYGPFVSAAERDYILQFLRKTFHLRTCKKLPKKPCLRYHIHLCDAPCIDGITTEEYEERIDHVKDILSGRSPEVITTLQHQMDQASSQQHYERALLLRNQLSAIEHLTERQNMQRMKTYNEDIINYVIRDLSLIHI